MTCATRNAAGALWTLLASALMPMGVFAAESRHTASDARAEIQIGLCAPAERIVQALDLIPRGPPIDVWHFDDSSLDLLGRGLRLRLRVAADESSELTLKVADQDCARLDAKLAPKGEGKCEYDVYGARTAGAVSLTRRLDAKDTRILVAGSLAPGRVLSAAQTAYLRDVAGAWPLPPGIRALGPMRVQTYRTKGNHYDVDMSQLPDGERYAEISRKVPMTQAAHTMEVMKDELSSAGVAMCADQSSPAADKLRALARQR